MRAMISLGYGTSLKVAYTVEAYSELSRGSDKKKKLIQNLFLN